MQYLQRLFYVSRAAGDAHQHIRRILSNCQVKKSSPGCHRRAGVLAFSGDHFAQILEGHEANLERLMAVVLADIRHCDLRIVFAELVDRREYGAWSMSYVEGFGSCERIEGLLNGERDAEIDVRVSRIHCLPILSFERGDDGMGLAAILGQLDGRRVSPEDVVPRQAKLAGGAVD